MQTRKLERCVGSFLGKRIRLVLTPPHRSAKLAVKPKTFLRSWYAIAASLGTMAIALNRLLPLPPSTTGTVQNAWLVQANSGLKRVVSTR